MCWQIAVQPIAVLVAKTSEEGAQTSLFCALDPKGDLRKPIDRHSGRYVMMLFAMINAVSCCCCCLCCFCSTPWRVSHGLSSSTDLAVRDCGSRRKAVGTVREADRRRFSGFPTLISRFVAFVLRVSLTARLLVAAGVVYVTWFRVKIANSCNFCHMEQNLPAQAIRFVLNSTRDHLRIWLTNRCAGKRLIENLKRSDCTIQTKSFAPLDWDLLAERELQLLPF